MSNEIQVLASCKTPEETCPPFISSHFCSQKYPSPLPLESANYRHNPTIHPTWRTWTCSLMVGGSSISPSSSAGTQRQSSDFTQEHLFHFYHLPWWHYYLLVQHIYFSYASLQPLCFWRSIIHPEVAHILHKMHLTWAHIFSPKYFLLPLKKGEIWVPRICLKLGRTITILSFLRVFYFWKKMNKSPIFF